MANRQTESTKNKPNGQQARHEPVVETVWESFPVIDPAETRPELPFDGRKTERDFEN